MTVSSASASAPSPVPLAIARSMLSLGIEASLAFCTARASDGLPSMSPPPSRAAVVIARASFVKSLPRRESTMAFLCLMEAHLECPDMTAKGSSGPGCLMARGEQLLVEGDVRLGRAVGGEVGGAGAAGDGGRRVLGELERLEHRVREAGVVVVLAGEGAADLGPVEDLGRRP